MNYPIIQPPFTLVFPEMSKKELRCYNEWFHKILPERIQVLTSTIRSTSGYQSWKPDCSPESLETLGEWFLAQVQSRPRTQEEIDTIQNQSKFPINIPREELTTRSFSLAMDIGMYVSQVFVKHHPSLQWSQPFGSKTFVDYGQPVLAGFGVLTFNPVQMMVGLAYGLVNQWKTGKTLREIYDYWSNLASTAAS